MGLGREAIRILMKCHSVGRIIGRRIDISTISSFPSGMWPISPCIQVFFYNFQAGFMFVSYELNILLAGLIPDIL